MANPFREALAADEPAEWIPERYLHESIRGARLPGWEDLNVAALADDIGIGAQHARQILSGRSEGRFSLYVRIARCLNITLDDLLRRRERARELDLERSTKRG